MGYTRKIALSINAERFLFYSENINLNDDWSNESFTKGLQPNGNLGNRMTKAFETAFQQNDKVVIIGSDCASLKKEIIDNAFKELDKHDFVIGPTFDGGYYLLGMNKFLPKVFEDINWSTETVFAETTAVIKSLDCTFFELPTLSDIDFEEDWEKYGWEL